jgi:hypothetical protein
VAEARLLRAQLLRQHVDGDPLRAWACAAVTDQ